MGDPGAAAPAPAERIQASATGQWLRVTDAARASGTTTGIVSRAVDTGALKGNGLKGRNRRVDGADLTRWQLARANRGEPNESDEAVERLVREHCRD
jgi:hypothetical protein